MKINVIGTSGSGKSTLAKQIATELAIPYIEMDRLYWRPDWQGTPDDVFQEKLELVTQNPEVLENLMKSSFEDAQNWRKEFTQKEWEKLL